MEGSLVRTVAIIVGVVTAICLLSKTSGSGRYPKSTVSTVKELLAEIKSILSKNKSRNRVEALYRALHAEALLFCATKLMLVQDMESTFNFEFDAMQAHVQKRVAHAKSRMK